jgi:hypothetical protein
MFCFRDISLRLRSIALMFTCIEAVEAVRIILVGKLGENLHTRKCNFSNIAPDTDL